MNLKIEPGFITDIDELEKLYDDLNDYLSATINYPGWIKGIYPLYVRTLLPESTTRVSLLPDLIIRSWVLSF